MIRLILLEPSYQDLHCVLFSLSLSEISLHNRSNKYGMTRNWSNQNPNSVLGEHSGSVVELQTPELEVGGLKPTSTVLCP